MVPYYFLVFVPVIFSLIRIKPLDEKVQKRIAVIAFFSILFLLLSLKAITVGNDTGGYLYKFNYISDLSWGEAISTTTEPAFVVLEKTVQLFTMDYQVFLTIVAAIIVVPVAWIYARESEIVAMMIAVLLIQSNFSMFFSGIRQCISISLGIIAFELVKRKKIVFFLLIVLLAYWFHNSAFMLIFMLPLYYFEITQRRLIIVVPIIIVMLIFNRQIFTFLQQFITDIYSGSIKETGAYTMLVVFVLFGVFAYLFPDEDEMDADTRAMRNYLVLAIVIQIFASVHPLAMRMGYYYTIFIPILLPKIVVKSTVWRQFAITAAVAMTVFFFLYFFIKTPSENQLHIFPYRFFWEV